jgi:hypothetical protein
MSHITLMNQAEGGTLVMGATETLGLERKDSV